MSNLKVKTILVSQPEPKVENSPYFELQQKHKVKIDFRSFIHIEGVSAKDIRAQKIEEFFICEAATAGVTTRKILKESSNPNKWENTMIGDGGQSGFDAAVPNFRFHTFFNATPDINLASGNTYQVNGVAHTASATASNGSPATKPAATPKPPPPSGSSAMTSPSATASPA